MSICFSNWGEKKRLSESHPVYNTYFQNELLRVSERMPDGRGQLCKSRGSGSRRLSRRLLPVSSATNLIRVDVPSRPITSYFRLTNIEGMMDVAIIQARINSECYNWVGKGKREKSVYLETALSEGSKLTSPIGGKWTSVPPDKVPREGQIPHIAHKYSHQGRMDLNQNMRNHQRNGN